MAAQQMDSRVLYTKGLTYEQAGQYSKAQACYQQSAMLGYGRSEFRLGIFCLHGKAGATDKSKAFDYFTKAANHENRDQAKACFNLGIMLEIGDGVKQSLSQACHWYKEAKMLGNTEAIAKVCSLEPQMELPLVAVVKPKPPTVVLPSSPAIAQDTPPVLPAKKIIYSELKMHEEVGKGSFGVAYRATWRQSETVAVKQLNAQLTEAGAAEFTAETKTLANLASQRLVRLIGVCNAPDPHCLIMEYMPKGSLYNVLHSQEQLSWPISLQIVIDVGQGLSYLHQEKIIHRDLKSKNILLDEHNRAKLTNFGLSKVKQESAISTKTVVGSPAWLAPEIFGLKPKYSFASDVYAAGTVLWEILTRKTPYEAIQDVSAIKAAVKAGQREAIPPTSPLAYKHLIESCWAQAPEARPRAVDIALDAQQQLLAAAVAGVKAWHCEPSLKPKIVTGEAYSLIDVPLDGKASDVQKVVDCYQRFPVANYDIKSIRIIYNLEFNRAFQARLMALQGRHNNPGFTPKWSTENSPAQRKAVIDKLEQMSASYQDPSCPDVKIMAMWHGTKPALLDSIFRTGFANLATTDPGFYGKGIYSTYEAEYANRVYSQGSLLVNFVASYSAYPVIDGDMAKLMSGANYANYDAHFAPVKPANPNDPAEVNYLPCAQHEVATYHELVVFESAQCLPRYLVELQPSLPKAVNKAPPPKDKKAALHP